MGEEKSCDDGEKGGKGMEDEGKDDKGKWEKVEQEALGTGSKKIMRCEGEEEGGRETDDNGKVETME